MPKTGIRKHLPLLAMFLEGFVVFFLITMAVAPVKRLFQNEDRQGKQTDHLRVPLPDGTVVEASYEINYPFRLKVGDERQIYGFLDLKLPPSVRSADFSFRIVSPTLSFTSSDPTRGTFKGVESHESFTYVVSGSQPGKKMAYMHLESQQVPVSITSPLSITVYEDTDWIKRGGEIAQTFGLPALIALIASEWIRRTSKRSEPANTSRTA